MTSVVRPGAFLALELPVPPSLNEMLDLAKRRTRRSRSGGWMRRSLPVVYDQRLEQYESLCLVSLARRRVGIPPNPWPRWRIADAFFRLHNLRDPVELLASLKWPVDVLVRLRFVANDSPRELVSVALPHQTIDRRNPGVTIQIAEVTP